MTKTVRVVAAFLAILMGLSALAMIAMYVSAAEVYDGTSVSAFLKGTGKADDPYLIANGADLEYFAENPVDGACYKLTNDIVWSSYVSVAGKAPTASNWKPVVFNGTFDGNGKRISGLCVVSEDTGVGFFAWAQGTIKNLTIAESYFKGATMVAGIVGRIEDFTDEDKAAGLIRSLVIDNCVSYADIVVTEKNGYSGGIIGGANRSGQIDLTVSGCVNYGKIFFDNAKENALVGGIAGQLNGRTIVIENCANYGEVVCSTPVTGGICAQVGGSSNKEGDGTSVTIRNCINNASVSASRITGGITGRLYANATVENCVNLGNVTANVTGKNAGQFGGIIGVNGGGKVINSFYLEGCATNTADAEAVGAADGTAKSMDDMSNEAFAASLGDHFELCNGQLSLKIVATAGSANTTEPAPDTTEPAPDTTEPAPDTTEPASDTTEPASDTTEPAPETTEPDASGNTGDEMIFYLVIAVVAVAATAVVSRKKEN